MTALDIFTRSGALVISSETIAEGTENQHKNVLQLIRTYREDLEEFGRVESETRPFETSGGSQVREVFFLNEPQATLILTYMRNMDRIRAFKKALVRAFFDMARQVTPAPAELTRLQILELAMESEQRAIAATARAEVAEEFKEAIELNDGITPRDFHKKYLPGVTETQFSAALYRHRLLIDQTGQRGRNAKGKIINGKQHRHPTYQGKAFFYLHSELDRDKIRREHVRVIPGEPELLLVKWCAARGLST
ncbi:Rha family transcriptional regulator [Cryobacterium sp. Y11]|uniref:Rha family transcriptional regulator n=1 Tax=Cryobacterium sp. Y11 TaxID=2045016 RepID=UPI000CE340C5|nr:Rha family transcriptional regulator [Cryobacterium sp. Y11]